ncbi:MAG: hypothetical protein FJ316_08710 [SAR202 cluster bacterium]|nr:hypothetical protein [SAR202 cluster bacterium]
MVSKKQAAKILFRGFFLVLLGLAASVFATLAAAHAYGGDNDTAPAKPVIRMVAANFVERA